MFVRAFIVAVLAVLAGTATARAAADSDFAQALREADAIRTSDSARFSRLVADLEKDVGKASPAERQYFELLQGYRLLFAGKLDEGVRDLDSLLAEKDMDVDLRVRASALLVNIYALSRDFTSGLKQIDRTAVLLDKVGNKDVRHQALLTATILYNQVGQYGLGLHNAETVQAENPNSRFLCMSGNLRLESLQGEGKAPPDDQYEKVLGLCKAIGEPIMANLARSYLAKKWFAEGKVDAAIELLESHLDEVKATGYRYLIGEFDSLISRYRLAKGDMAGAEAHAKAAIEQGGEFPTTFPFVVAYETLYRIAEQRDEPDTALMYYKRYAEADKVYLDEVKTREMAYQIVQHETKAQAQQIELLNKQNQVLQLQQRVNEQKAQSQRLLILLLIVLVGSVGYWAFKTKRVQMSLKRMAETDALTSICNRHHFTQQSAHTLAQAARAGEDVALVMFDLDHFKSINDRFGHDVGDWVLKKVAEHCRTFCRRVDHLGRIGGEEFAILLAGCDLRGATRVAEDCRVRIASIDSQPCGHKFLVTASFGVTASSLSGYDLAKLLSHADKSLYRSKRDGRNRVSTYDGDIQPWTQLQVVAADGQPDDRRERTLEVASDDPFRRLSP
jgi:diguanylate cyclase (GGDEF)-like protein